MQSYKDFLNHPLNRAPVAFLSKPLFEQIQKNQMEIRPKSVLEDVKKVKSRKNRMAISLKTAGRRHHVTRRINPHLETEVDSNSDDVSPSLHQVTDSKQPKLPNFYSNHIENLTINTGFDLREFMNSKAMG